MHVSNYEPCPTLLQCLSYSLGYFSRRFGEISNKLPVGTSEEEDEDNIDEQKQEVFLQERIFNPTAGPVTLCVSEA